MSNPPVGELKVGRNFFTPNEREMLQRDWLKPFCELDGKRLAADQGKGGDSQTKKFTKEVLAAFLAEFPYRRPEARKDKQFPPHLRRLACSSLEWKALGAKIRAWLQKKKPANLKNNRKGTRSSIRPREQEKGQLSDDDDDDDDDDDGATDDDEEVPEVYETSARELKNMEQSLNGLCNEATYPWSQVSAEALERRRDALPADLDDIVQGLSRSTGASIYAVAVYGEGTEVTAVETVSTRCKAFVNTNESDGIRDGFTDYIIRHIGQEMFGRRDNPVPTVYGDEPNSFKPILPSHMQSHEYNVRMLVLYANSMWLWQGGRGEVPWTLLKDDGVGGTYQLLEQQRLPEGCSYMDYPPNMSPEVAMQFYQHILAGQNKTLPEECMFQFYQPRPGVVESVLRKSMAEGSELHYPPESWIYAQRQGVGAKVESEAGERRDELPAVEAPLYQSITEKQFKDAQEWVPSEDSALILLRALMRHDEAAPHQLPITDWPSKGSQCPHIGPEPPATHVALLAFKHDNGFLAEAFYNPNHPEHIPWSLNSCLAWVNVQNWMHEPSGTLEGGPYGVKWPVLLLTQIRACHLFFTSKTGRKPSYYGRVATDMSVRELAMIERAIDDMTQALDHSTAILQSSLEQRRKGASGNQDQALVSNAVSVSMEEVRVLNAPEPPCEWKAYIEDLVEEEEPEPENAPGPSSAPLKRAASEAESSSKRTRLRSPKSMGKGKGKGKAKAKAKGKQGQSSKASDMQMDPPRPRTRSSTRQKPRLSVSFAREASAAGPSGTRTQSSDEDSQDELESESDDDESPTPKRHR